MGVRFLLIVGEIRVCFRCRSHVIESGHRSIMQSALRLYRIYFRMVEIVFLVLTVGKLLATISCAQEWICHWPQMRNRDHESVVTIEDIRNY